MPDCTAEYLSQSSGLRWREVGCSELLCIYPGGLNAGPLKEGRMTHHHDPQQAMRPSEEVRQASVGQISRDPRADLAAEVHWRP